MYCMGVGADFSQLHPEEIKSILEERTHTDDTHDLAGLVKCMHVSFIISCDLSIGRLRISSQCIASATTRCIRCIHPSTMTWRKMANGTCTQTAFLLSVMVLSWRMSQRPDDATRTVRDPSFTPSKAGVASIPQPRSSRPQMVRTITFEIRQHRQWQFKRQAQHQLSGEMFSIIEATGQQGAQ